MKREPTLKELLRQEDDTPALDLEPVQAHFKEGEMPIVDASPVGRLRLIRAFSRKYGPNFRSFPGVADAIKHYDQEVKVLNMIKKNKGALRG